MIIDSAQQFVLEYPGPPAGALAFVRDPARSLSRVRFLRELSARPDEARGGVELRGELIVQLPVLGQVDLPFFSVLQNTEGGATLLAQPLEHERAWVEVRGVAQLQLLPSPRNLPPAARTGNLPSTGVGTPVSFDFQFRAHLATPHTGDQPEAGAAGQGWGGAAFGKMVRASANRTLQRVASELPGGIHEAMQAAP